MKGLNVVESFVEYELLSVRASVSLPLRIVNESCIDELNNLHDGPATPMLIETVTTGTTELLRYDVNAVRSIDCLNVIVPSHDILRAHPRLV